MATLDLPLLKISSPNFYWKYFLIGLCNYLPFLLMVWVLSLLLELVLLSSLTDFTSPGSKVLSDLSGTFFLCSGWMISYCWRRQARACGGVKTSPPGYFLSILYSLYKKPVSMVKKVPIFTVEGHWFYKPWEVWVSVLSLDCQCFVNVS